MKPCPDILGSIRESGSGIAQQTREQSLFINKLKINRAFALFAQKRRMNLHKTFYEAGPGKDTMSSPGRILWDWVVRI
jgi:hypothetical protein